MARLIRTEKEVEGRFEEVWLVVEEDPLEQWPAGPLSVVGRPATRKSGPARARGEARFTADLQLPGMLQAALLRSPHAHARVKRIDLAPALALPGVRAAIGPGEAPGLEQEAGFAGAPVAAVAADTYGQALRALAAVEVEWEVLEAVLDPDEAVAREAFTAPPRRTERGDVERALAEADVVVEATYRTQPVLHNSLETHQAVCEWAGDALTIHISTQYVWGVRAEVAERLGLPADKVRVVCEYMGGGFGSKNGPDEHTFAAAELARRTGRPGAVCAEPARGARRSGQPQRDDPAADGRRAQRRHDRRARRRVHERRRLVGLVGPDRGADDRCSTRATTSGPSPTARS